MEWSQIKPVVVYISPAGTTEKTAQFISQSFEKFKKRPKIFNLAEVTDHSDLYDSVKKSEEQLLLFVGSPVYVGHPLPPVLEFLEQLPAGENNLAVPFATWGAVSSGVALREMADILNEKQFKVCGAASILAEHSQMWSADDPLAENKPANAEKELLEELVENLRQRINSGASVALELEDLDYLPEEMREDYWQTSLEKIKPELPPKDLNQDLCTRCRICLENCPVNAIEFTPYPEFQKNCIYCFNCVRVCPEEALKVPTEKMVAMLRKKAEESPEPKQSRIFLPE
ncbi:MAG: EFR1 family ferrodoxin [bacterium]